MTSGIEASAANVDPYDEGRDPATGEVRSQILQ